MKLKLLITLFLLISLLFLAESRKIKKKTKNGSSHCVSMILKGTKVTCSFTTGEEIGAGASGKVYEVTSIRGKDSFCRSIPKNLVLKIQGVQSQKHLDQAWKETKYLIN